MTDLLQIEHLMTQFHTKRGVVRAVDDVSLTVGAGEALGIVGESGCGKSVTMLSVMRLIPNPLMPQMGGRIAGGHVWFEGRDLMAITEAEMQKVRGNQIAMIFQDPMTSLNPTMRIGKQLTESLALHRGLGEAVAQREAIRLLEMVEIPSARERLGDYPYQFSGGMRQRVMIAIALAGSPKLLIADEPTTALDVTIQAQILDLLAGLQAELGMAIILISHNLGVVAGVSDRIAVMYAGKLIELAPAEALFAAPAHPYTQALLRAVPSVDAARKARLANIPGAPPDLIAPPAGCRFGPRCDCAKPRCANETPGLLEVAAGHWVACFAGD
jgi:oligopeptide transport system ATP-binding protein